MHKIIGNILFSNYTSAFQEKKGKNHLIKRHMVPKYFAKLGHTIYSRNIKKIDSHEYIPLKETFFAKKQNLDPDIKQNLDPDIMKRLQNIHTLIEESSRPLEPLKKSQIQVNSFNQEKIKDYLSSDFDSLSNYVENLYEVELCEKNGYKITPNLKDLHQDIENYAYWIAAHPNYHEMSKQELTTAFPPDWQKNIRKKKQTPLSAANLHEATNFALHVFLRKTLPSNNFRFLHEEIKNSLPDNQKKHPSIIPVNRCYIIEADGHYNLLQFGNNSILNENTYQSEYYSFDFLEAEKRQDIFNAIYLASL